MMNQILSWTSPAQFGAPLILGAQGKLSMLPPPPTRRWHWLSPYTEKTSFFFFTTEWLPLLQSCWKENGLWEVFFRFYRLIARGNQRGSCPDHLITTILTTDMWGNHLLALKARKFLTATLKCICKDSQTYRCQYKTFIAPATAGPMFWPR